MAEMIASRDPEVIEAALLGIARRIEPAGYVELIRETGEHAEYDRGADLRTDDVDAGRERPQVEEFRLSCGAADHGWLRLYLSEAGARPADRRVIRRRMAMACTVAACALEGARHHAEWGWGRGDVHDGEPSGHLTGDDESGMRAPHQPRDVVRDATFLNAVLPFALEQSRRHGEPVSLVCVKLDRLGAIRDLLGSSLADRMVHELGEIVGSVVRASDLVARLDDDRIVALLVRSRGDDAMKVARSIGHAVAESGLGSPRLPGTSVSIGVAEFPTIARDAGSLLDAADEAMTVARAGGSHSPVMAGRRGEPDRGSIHDDSTTVIRPPAMSACVF
jgi:diguanylate cyclase (GGDEF)-like protein